MVGDDEGSFIESNKHCGLVVHALAPIFVSLFFRELIAFTDLIPSDQDAI
jgi:hypothetical protein